MILSESVNVNNSTKDGIILFEDKSQCCGCSSCANACPKNAITIVPDEYGFVYPSIDKTLCVNCDACKKACGYQNSFTGYNSVNCFAATAKDNDLLRKSSSGGVFGVLADCVLKNGGSVYGASLQWKESIPFTNHIRIDSCDDLHKLQGSKYVQSNIGTTYLQAKKDLEAGMTVLFSGTPCQIAGLKGFLEKDYDKLITVDIICHGVPNEKMFQEFLETKQKKGKKITDFSFRTKEKGQGMNVGISYKRLNEKIIKKIRNANIYSYMHYFLKSYIYRINCYTCPFAQKLRISDITIGDFWGFHEEYPTVPSNFKVNNSSGISCVLVNTQEGNDFFLNCSENMHILPSEFEKIERHNAQLRKPSELGEKRNVILQMYRENGYEAIEKYYYKTCKKIIIFGYLQSLLPKKLKRLVMRIKGILRND